MTFGPDKMLVHALLVTVSLMTGIKARWRTAPQVGETTDHLLR
ncbi:MAG: hypothetical protein ACSLEN_01865 [Candidatus Malihini olakiniferum]